MERYMLMMDEYRRQERPPSTGVETQYLPNHEAKVLMKKRTEGL